MQRWALFLANNLYQLVYKPGSKISKADGLSRLPVEDYFTPLTCLEEVVFSMSALDLTPVTSKSVAFYTSEVPVLSQVRKWILQGWPVTGFPQFQPYTTKKDIGTIGLCFMVITGGYPGKVSRYFTERIAYGSSGNFTDEVSCTLSYLVA